MMQWKRNNEQKTGCNWWNCVPFIGAREKQRTIIDMFNEIN